MGRCCWEGNVVHSTDLQDEGWSIHLCLPKDNHSLDQDYSIPSPHPNFTWEHRPEHALEEDVGGQDLGKQQKKQKTKNGCSERGAGAKSKGC